MERSPELEKIIVGWFEAVSRGDTSWVDHHVSQQARVRLVGTDPNEWLDGEQVAEFLKEEAKALAPMGVKVSPGEPEAYREGTVGWGITRPTLTLATGKVISPRWSAVFHQEDAKWKLVQLHASVGIPNEQLLGGELFQG